MDKPEHKKDEALSHSAGNALELMQGAGVEWSSSTFPYPGFSWWAQRLAIFADGIARTEPEIHKRIMGILCQLYEPGVRLTFGGHFSSGKSTIINAALERSILPVDDLPETGAICILSPGARDAAEVTSGSRRRPIECTTAAIQREVSLISNAGERRMNVQQVDQLDIMLRTGAIPPRAAWIDSPGINDTGEMNERALRAAHLGDILLWVLTSHQPLSETEMAFVAQYIAERGPAAVVFLLNTFLTEATLQKWEYFLTNKFRIYKNKIMDYAPFMGFTSQDQPEVIVVAGRAVCNGGGDGFGGWELRQFLRSLASADHPRIQRARLHRAVIELYKLDAEIKQHLAQERISIEKLQVALQKQRQEVERKRAGFKRAVEGAVDNFLADCFKAARAHSVALASGITATSLKHDDSYSRILNERLKLSVSQSIDRLLTQVSLAARQFDQSLLSNTHLSQLQRLLRPSEVVVVVPGKTSTPARNLMRAVEGSIAGFSKVDEKIAQGTRANIQQVTEQVLARLQKKRAEVVAFIVSYCVAAGAPQEAQPDDAALRRREGLEHSLARLADEATSVMRDEGIEDMGRVG